MLSRLPLPDFPNQIPTPGKIILLFDILYSLPVTAEYIKKLNQDPTLSREEDTDSTGLAVHQ